MNRQDIEAFVDEAPPYGEETHGETVRLAIVNRLMGALPGHIIETSHIYTRQGQSWRKFFFPNYTAGPLYPAVDRLTGLDEAFWSRFSTVLLCASIRQMSHETVKLVDSDKVDQSLAGCNSQLQQDLRLVGLYAHVLATDWAPLAKILSGGDAAAARAIFLERLSSDAWRAERRDLMAANDWLNFDWDIFHYWVKLLALGADRATIDAAARDLANAFAVPFSVSAGQWNGYFQWLRPPGDPLRTGEISHAEFDAEAARGILMTRFRMSPGRGGMSMPTQYEIPEGYASHFMLGTQPGNDFRVAPRDSCFGAGTPVLMADGQTMPIEEIAPGALVATPSGPAKVAVLVRTARAGRPLFRINGGRAAFTEAHPFLAPLEATSDPGRRRHPAFLAVSPALLGQTVPTLSWFGVDRLEPGAALRGWSEGAATKVTVESLDSDAAMDAHEAVYDVVVWPDRMSDCQYIVCNGKQRLVVAAEIPLLSKAPLAMRVVLALLGRLAPLVERHAGGKSLADVEAELAEFLSIVAHDALPAALRRAGPATQQAPASTAPSPTVEGGLAETFDRLRAGGDYDVVFGRLVAMLVKVLGPAIDSAIALGFRTIAAPKREDQPEVLALSFHDIAFRKWVRPTFQKPIDVSAAMAGAAFSPALAGVKPTPADRPFLRRLNAVAYLAPSGAAAGPIATIRFDVAAAGEPAVFGEAAVDLTPGSPVRRYSARLVDAANRPVGRLSFDLRPLSAAERLAEQAASAGWSDAAMDAFASRLSSALADEAASLFATLHSA